MSRMLATTAIVRRLVLRPSRIVVAVLLHGLMLLTAFGIRMGDAPRSAIPDLVHNGVLLVAVPLVSLLFAISALGDARDDGTLVYLWLKPLPRWQLATAAALATTQILVPVSLMGGLGVAVIGGRADLALAAMAASGLASLAYALVFIGLGLRTTRSLLAGLAFLLLWEGFFAALSPTIATLSVRRWASGLFSGMGDVRTPLQETTTTSAVVVLVCIALAGVALTTRWLTNREVP